MIDLNGFPILSAIIFGPLIGAVILAFLPRDNFRLIRWAVPKLGRPLPVVPLRRPKALIWLFYPASVFSGVPGSKGE